ncbi:hypothetical protein COU23_01585 [Candidatus Kuenenbacteria bacterium CG10_big_fil_rev_8_21_14_0_10_36_11]|uniref:Uncharacterized protein n=1 Tax=Candidatus Kuenenbacteria bacterium CG10_big_fil_rev_8_21_14_0_10_36_11 TaxID=1974618 RepID=A0A2M6WAS7_9BACT|nr:MAG: hypothetical protein COU23_01585 [Candidatus Kuenenbacteria bacterium CG10_big_fil_rev_8_21_14_0_10_36_11]
MEIVINLGIILISLAVFFVFKKIKNYITLQGGVLGLLVVLLIVFKTISGAFYFSRVPMLFY